AADASKQKKLAELAASDAMQKKSQAERDRADAEAQRVAALDAARSAQVARDAAEKQRRIAEKAADTAVAAKSSAETSLGELTAKRQAAERAAADLEARSKAEAKAQAEMIAAQTRKASDNEVAKAKAELAKLAADREQAEGELADRRKAVALQQAEANRLETAATQAHDAANREETRRAELAQERAAEEAALAAARSEAAIVKAQLAMKPAAKPPAAPAAAAPKQVAEAKPTAKPTKVTAIEFKGDEGSGQVTIAVGDDANVQIGEITATHAELIVDNAELAQKLERKLDVSRLGSPVRAVSSFRDRHTPNRVRLVAELTAQATPTVDRENGTVRWHFTSVEAVAKRPVKITNVPSPVVGGFGAASTPVAQQTVTQLPPQGQRRRIYHGATIDLDIRDAPIHDLLRLLSDTGHVNIVIPDTITPKVTVKLKRVPWDQALEVILQSNGLWYRRDGNIYRIATRKELDTEDQEEAARRDAALKAESPRVERQGLNYASASELKPRLESMLSPHGRIEVDERTNALLINDVAANRAEIIRLALELDTQTPQISIEARIVEARSTFLRQIGVQWGGNAIAGAGGGNATGLIWPSSIAVTGANTDQQTISTGVAAPSDFAVNLPAATGAGEGGALGFSLGSIGGNFNINLRLSALEDTGTVRIISAPKITVLNNKQASISQGVSIPISVVSAAGTNTQFVQADLKLEVTPYVSQRDCAIAMNLVVQKNEPDFVNVGARGDPTILRKEAKTQMLVNDGETTVLGGIYTRNAGVAYKKIPLFGDIPVLGWLFKNRRENDDRTEILVFITPKITNKGSLPCVK
ncbi:MAG: type IV pilus secretin PilQ, partial [Kofleriaceae bacterium]